MKYKIITDNNPIMRNKSLEVELPLKKEDHDLLDFMLTYIIKSQDPKYFEKHNIKPGIGLAAIQLGILKRMFVVYIDHGEQGVFKGQFVNPKIIETSIKKAALSNGEGCLSVEKEHQGLVHRNYKITFKAYDALTNKEITQTISGLNAICFQHEYDHLDGIFFYDRIDKENPNKQLENEEII